MTAEQPSGVFMQVDQAHVAAVGPTAAIVFSRICWRADRDGSWSASAKAISDETGLPIRSVRTALTTLRERDWVRSEQAGGYDRTPTWVPVLAGQDHVPGFVTCMSPESSDGSDGNAHIDVTESGISSTKTVDRETTTPAAHADGGHQEEPMTPVPASHQDALIPTVAAAPPVEAGPAKTAQTLVARWVDGYRAANGHEAPNPLMKRVAGQMRNLANACTSHDDWVAAYAAAYDTGLRGRWDPVAYMSRQRPQGRMTNAFVTPALGGPGAQAVAAIQAAFAVPAPPELTSTVRTITAAES